MKSRRALSTVVGAVFAIIALTSTVTYVSYSMGILDNYNQSVLTKNQQLSDVNKEKFQISSVTVPNSKLNITVVNTGSIPINFTKIWIQNTTATDWVRSYVPTHNFVASGGVLTNIGQNSGVNINPADSYNVKLVTSRGNTQQFTVNSANGAKLNIQLMFLPPTVSSGFKSELLMVVLNNSTGTLANVSPSSLPNPTYGVGNSGNLQCTVGSVNPSTYSTLAPGSVAFFTWDITTSGGNGGDTCTYNLTQPLQNGYLQAVSPPIPLKVAVVTLSSTTYAQSAGVITVDYTSFKWAQAGNTIWNNDWQFPTNTNTAFQVTFANNNQTAGGYSLFLSKNSQLIMTPTGGNSGGAVHQPYVFYIVKSATANPYGMTAYNPDYVSSIENQGGTGTLYFGSATVGGSTNSCGGSCTNNLPTGQYYGMLILYGKFSNDGGNTGGTYAQTIPFFAVITS